MYTLFISLAIVSSILLVLVVLAQNSKGGGLTSQFGGSGASNLIGVKKTGDLLERLTWGFAISIIIFSLATSVSKPTTLSNAPDEIMEKANQQSAPAIPQQLNKPADSTGK